VFPNIFSRLKSNIQFFHWRFD